MQKENCKRCSEKQEPLTRDEVERQAAASFLLPEEEVEEEVYCFRKSVCYNCFHLIQDTTCSLCGCYVAVRAIYINKTCPDLPDHWKTS